MAKKFGKFLLFTAAVGTAAAAIYYYVQKKEAVNTEPEDDDYDDFNEDLDEDAEPSRNYVPLKTESAPAEKAPEDFTPLEQVVKGADEASAQAEETVEEFFDEEDNSEEEPSVSES